MFTLKLPRRIKFLRAMWYLRDAINFPAIRVSASGFEAEVHMLVGKYHLYAAVAALKSFFLNSELAQRLGLTFHLDSTVRSRHELFLREHFPDAHYVNLGTRNERLDYLLNNRPFCREFYQNHLFGPKLFQVAAFSRSKRVILMDSDTFFYRRPDAIVDWVMSSSETPMYLDEFPNGVPHRDLRLALEDLDRQMGFACDKLMYLNAGLLLFEPERVDCDLIERFLIFQAERPNKHTGGWALEQTAYLINYIKWGNAIPFDSSDYACGSIPGRVFSHFLGANYYEVQNLSKLQKQLQALEASMKKNKMQRLENDELLL